nr:MAG TPA: hypothetical protein [Caudoviricetes sp.]
MKGSQIVVTFVVTFEPWSPLSEFLCPAFSLAPSLKKKSAR